MFILGKIVAHIEAATGEEFTAGALNRIADHPKALRSLLRPQLRRLANDATLQGYLAEYDKAITSVKRPDAVAFYSGYYA